MNEPFEKLWTKGLNLQAKALALSASKPGSPQYEARLRWLSEVDLVVIEILSDRNHIEKVALEIEHRKGGRWQVLHLVHDANHLKIPFPQLGEEMIKKVRIKMQTRFENMCERAQAAGIRQVGNMVLGGDTVEIYLERYRFEYSDLSALIASDGARGLVSAPLSQVQAWLDFRVTDEFGDSVKVNLPEGGEGYYCALGIRGEVESSRHDYLRCREFYQRFVKVPQNYPFWGDGTAIVEEMRNARKRWALAFQASVKLEKSARGYKARELRR